MALRRDIRIASFDGGGGARTFSQLRILGQIMSQLNRDKYNNESDKIMLPCEHFDLIGGSGTGGLSAIMFGRLRMSVEEVSDEFLTIVEKVYKPDDLTPPERTQKLRECMEDVMERRRLPTDMKLMDKTQPGHCASFVLASPCTDAAEKVCLRTYPVRNQLASTITVIEAVVVACAVPPAFSSVTSGSGHNKHEYIGASFGATNPIREVITEAHSLFGGDSSVASLLSLGAGHPGVISFPSGDGVDLNRAMRDMMNDCEQRAQEIERQIVIAKITCQCDSQTPLQPAGHRFTDSARQPKVGSGEWRARPTLGQHSLTVDSILPVGYIFPAEGVYQSGSLPTICNISRTKPINGKKKCSMY